MYICTVNLLKKIYRMKTFLVLSPQIIILVVVVVVILFGGKKLPELMKGIGKGIKGFKDEMKDDDKKIEK